MIVSLRGVLAGADLDKVVIEAGGLGYGVLVPGRLASALSRRVGDEVFVHTYLHVRDDALQLFGFESPRERRFFVTLIGVSGVGPKVALAILSAYSVRRARNGRAARRRQALRVHYGHRSQACPASRDRAQRQGRRRRSTLAPASADGAPAAGADPFLQARVALQNLGLPLREAEAALQGAPEGAPLEELVRYALTRKGGERRTCPTRRGASPTRSSCPTSATSTSRCGPNTSPTSWARPASRSSSRSSSRRLATAARRSTTCCWPGRPAWARRPSPASSPPRCRSAFTPPRARRSNARSTSPASSPTCSRATCCSSTRSTGSTRPSKRCSTRRWRTSRSTS